MFPEFHLSKRDQYRLTTLTLTPISLVLLASGLVMTLVTKPKMLRLKELTSAPPTGFSMRPALALEPYLDDRGAAGGQLRISF